MAPSAKFTIVCEAYRFGRILATEGIRMRFPEADDAQVQHIWIREHLGEELYKAVYGIEENE